MIRNYIKTAFRSLLKNKGFTAINVFGLVLGLASCLLIVFYVYDELSYDRYNTKSDRIYRINGEIKFGGSANTYAVAPAPAAADLKSDFPEIEEVARFRERGGNQVKKGNQNIPEEKMVFADPAIFKVFTLPTIVGDAATALSEPNSVVITEKTAKKYFNSTNVVGQILTLNDTALYKITAVINDIPSQSHFNFDFFLSMSSLPESRNQDWFSNNFNTYVLIRKGSDAKKLGDKLPAFMHRHAGPLLESMLHMDFNSLEKSGSYFRLQLIPLRKIHLESNSVAELAPNGDIVYVYMFSAIAIFILLIACVNFMNLSTARSANRAREVGVRKVLGSPRSYLIAQFLTESVMITLVAAILAVLVAWIALPLFNLMSGKELEVSVQMVYWLIPVLIVIIIIIGVLAGSYPAFFLSGFNPIDVLKGKLAAGFKGGKLRSFLVIFQFAISIFLIIGTLVIYNQLKYIQSKDLGYNRNHVLIISNVAVLGNNAKTFKQSIKQISGVENATLTGALPTSDFNNSMTFFKNQVIDQKNAIDAQDWNVDEDYILTLGIKMEAGRNFSNQMGTDSTGVIINEAAAKLLDFSNPINKVLYAPKGNIAKSFKAYHIIGVMNDFNFRSLRNNITPLFLLLDEDRGALSIHINSSSNIPLVLSQIKDKWNALSPSQQLSYSFMDENFDALYRSEQRMGTIFMTFTSLAIIIACLGLFGLAAYAAEQRTKEIGIRKVLGASISTIVGMLSKDFLILVSIAILITSPLAWFVMTKWLDGFAYRQGIQWWIFVLAGSGSILIAFITISFQSIKAALLNPVKSIKSE